jgi:haloalkane dehalogenase
MEILRTPDDCFADLHDFPFAPHWLDVDGLRVHYLDEGPRDAAPVLLLHGEPAWSYAYRTVIPVLTAAGHRCIAPDLVGFGRSDKPSRREDYTYQRHVDWMRGVLLGLDLQRATLVCHDWGGLIGLRLLAEHPERFARAVAANTGLPTGEVSLSPAFSAWREFSQETPQLPVSGLVQMGCKTSLPPEVRAAYDAPFPDESFKAGARQFPVLVPVTPDDPAADANRRAWAALGRFTKPFLTAFSDGDTVSAGGEEILRERIPGAQGQPHTTIHGAGHFLQEDAGPALAAVVADFIARG